MNSPIASRAASGLRPAASIVLAVSVLTVTLIGCKAIEEPGAHVAGWTLIDPSERHPIMVSQQPASTSINVARGSQGLTPGQKAQIAGFIQHYRSQGTGSGRLVIAVPSGSPNEGAAMRAIGDVRPLISDLGVSDSDVVIEPYRAGRDANAPIRLTYLRFVAEGPACGQWPSNLADNPRNLPYPNFGCAQQRNLAAQIANPADLLGPRTMTPADAERRGGVFDNYQKGKTTGAEKGADERVQVRGGN